MPQSKTHPQSDAWYYLGIFVLVIFIAGPMVWVLGYSLLYSMGGTGLFSAGWTGAHWGTAFSAGGLVSSLYYTPLIAASVTVLATLISLTIALGNPRLQSDRRALVVLCLIMATPSAVMAVMVYQVFNPGGYLARLLYHAGAITSPSDIIPLVNDPYSVGMLFAQTCTAFPLLTLFFLKTWSSARLYRYCRLAESLGASKFQARWKVALPMLLNRGRMLILLIFLLNLGSYEIPLLLGRQSPQMFSVLTQRQFGLFDLQQRPQAFVLATAYFFISGMGVLLLLRWRRAHV
ncbi:hypothetical protein V6x_20600 [Gimesia chilikensis]|uniref:ABC transmembrane type-1 domain-containing protein n=1 Tax=Gimesia chilikensis TaxID=2605989 RepID=A0A517WAT7_9PLAN|nr:hypothetical protein [Gimesia chilikensis]QDU02358.1 hypothetical protein V6x_20600 [Gimesia chilikensis]